MDGAESPFKVCAIYVQSGRKVLPDYLQMKVMIMIISASSNPNWTNEGSLNSSHQDESNISRIMSLGSIDAEISLKTFFI
jgi:hypothetical protein